MVDTVITRQAPFIENYIRRLLEQSFARGETPTTLPETRIADLSPIVQQQIADAQGLRSFLPLLQESGDLIRGSARPITAETIQPFMDPYRQQVTQAALAEMDRQADIARNRLGAEQVRQGAFGGTRGALQQAELDRNLQDIKSQRIFQDQSANYQQAVKNFQDQLSREQTTGSMLGTLGQAGTQLVGGLGSLGQAQQQAQFDADFQNRARQIADPYSRLGFLRDTISGVPSSASAATTAIQPSASPFSQALGAATTGLGAFRAFTGQPQQQQQGIVS